MSLACYVVSHPLVEWSSVGWLANPVLVVAMRCVYVFLIPHFFSLPYSIIYRNQSQNKVPFALLLSTSLPRWTHTRAKNRSRLKSYMCPWHLHRFHMHDSEYASQRKKPLWLVKDASRHPTWIGHCVGLHNVLTCKNLVVCCRCVPLISCCCLQLCHLKEKLLPATAVEQRLLLLLPLAWKTLIGSFSRVCLSVCLSVQETAQKSQFTSQTHQTSPCWTF